MKNIAHIKIDDGQTYKLQSLPDHLTGTAEIASRFASAFNNTEWGKLLGLWHDLGKYSYCQTIRLIKYD